MIRCRRVRPDPPDRIRAVGPGDSDRGSVTAELAIVLPVVVLVLVLGAVTLSACARQVRLQDAAADAARLLARGEPESRARSIVTDAVEGSSFAVEQRDDLVCVRATVGAGIPLPAPVLSVTSCALAGGL
jgi:hypothetical protein